jgi:hypothetical protein
MSFVERARERVGLDAVCGAVVLLVVLIFWLQRSYNNPLVGYFPDTILAVRGAC